MSKNSQKNSVQNRSNELSFLFGVIFMDIISTLKEIISIVIAGVAFPGLNFHVKPGLYPVGNPTEESPVLITSNYFVTYKRVLASLRNQSLKVWLLVIDTGGVNVWCSAAGGSFTAEKIISHLQEVDLSESVSHKDLIAPQLCATGVDHTILAKAGWKLKFGPIDIDDLGEYIVNKFQKTEKSSQIDFSVKKRLENTLSHNSFISLILLPLILLVDILAHPIGFLRPLAEWLVFNFIFLFLYIWFFGLIYGIIYPKIPFNSGFLKGLIVSIVIVPICSFTFFTRSELDFIISVGTILLYSTVISTDFDGFTSLHGMDFFEKDLVLLIISSILIILGLVLFPLFI